ncbi:signal recognition particle protein [Cryptosporangium sp. NPDC051539]|uniref:signal recognition particle protein n=1 Tax=Cryptosporangium sp. NPDC051539 TaxID=3363962 RepID=UPI0037973391
MFDTLSDRLSAVFTSLRSKGRLTDADIDKSMREIRVALLEADVALPVVKSFVQSVKNRARGSEVHQALNPAQQVVKIVNEELVGILGGETRRLRYAKTPPTVILLAGLQGAGKTTLAGKLALWLRKQGHTPLLVAADLQRPNAVQQLQVVGQRAEVEVFAPEPGSGVGDPVKVSRDSIEFAKRQQHDIVVVDTAGRLGIDADMMAQAAAIRDAVNPDEILFVVDAMIGQDAVTTAQAFKDGVGFDGVVLTKLDGDARGGAALSVRHVTGEPIMFASSGEKLDEFDVFHPDRMASRILGMGDMLTLIEQAEGVFDAEQQQRMSEKMLGEGDFTLDDFLEQMVAVKKMGPISNVLGMLPGMNQMKGQLDNLDDKHFDRVAAVIRSMTPLERQDPKIINGSRRLRIANGSGTTVTDVNQLVERFFEARKMMRQMTSQLGFGGGMRRGGSKKGGKGKKGRKGGGGGGRPRQGLPGGMPGALPPGFPGALPAAQEAPEQPDALPGGFNMPKIDFSKLPKK